MTIIKIPNEITIINGNVDTVLGRLTSTRAGYMDNLTNLDDTITGTSTIINDTSTIAANALTAANNASDAASTANLNAINALTAANNTAANACTVSTVGINASNIGASTSSAANLARACIDTRIKTAMVSSRTLRLHSSQWIQSSYFHSTNAGWWSMRHALGCKGTM
jgi:hypothetical protein